ncbi:MAG: CTP synthase, partial [Alphaproteobacteria bacterium]|nr:CTP synthase [Alphaproteobacteria bacterium]
IAIVGKYTTMLDSYKSLAEALTHGGVANNVRVNIKWLDSQVFESADTLHHLEGVDGILVPGGFGERGTEGKIRAAQFARENKIPYFGICFGMQLAVIEAVRNLGGIPGATSSEFGPSDSAVIGLMTEWVKGNKLEIRKSNGDLGGTMRLGAYPCHILPGTKLHEIYGTDLIHERHRHRYEVNITYRPQFEKAGLVFAGMSPEGELPEMIERKDHPWFIGVQFHPELKSKPLDPHPLFRSFIEAAVQKSRLV